MLEQGLKIQIDWFYSMTVDGKKKDFKSCS